MRKAAATRFSCIFVLLSSAETTTGFLSCHSSRQGRARTQCSLQETLGNEHHGTKSRRDLMSAASMGGIAALVGTLAIPAYAKVSLLAKCAITDNMRSFWL
jgi:hypothetical protein